MLRCSWYVPHLAREMGPFLPEEGEMGPPELGLCGCSCTAALLTVMLLVFTWLHCAQENLRKIVGIIPCLILLRKLYNASWEEVGELSSTMGQAWDGTPEQMNTMPLSLEHDGLGRCCSPLTAAWTMRPQHPELRPGVNMEEGAAPCSSAPTTCAASSTVCARERLRVGDVHLEPDAPLSSVTGEL